jgi:hypothetical protein
LAIIAGIVAAAIIIGVIIWLFWPPLPPPPVTAMPLLAINDCDSTDLDLVSDGRGNYYSIYDCPRENRVEIIKVMNEANDTNDYVKPVAFFEGVGQTHVSISVASDGTVHAFAIVGDELRAVTCANGNITGCEENPEPVSGASQGQQNATNEMSFSFMPDNVFQNIAYYNGFDATSIMPVHQIPESCLGHHDSAVGPDGAVYEVWENDCEGEILFSASNDNGATWSDPANLSNNSGESRDPRVVVSGDVVYVTWIDNTAGNDEVTHSRSTDKGATFNGATGSGNAGDPINLSNTAGGSTDHEICASGNDLYVVWRDENTGSGDIYLVRNNDAQAANQDYAGGFDAFQNLDPDANVAYEPDLDCQGSTVIVGFTRETQASSGHGDAFFTQSTNEGSDFSAPINVSNNADGDSKTALVSITSGNEIYEAWLDTAGDREHIADGTYAVFAAKSADGRTFSPPTNYSDDPANLKPNGNVTPDVFELEDKICAWDYHCVRCQSPAPYY